MPAHRRTRQHPHDRGGVTVEAAIAMAAFVLLLAMALGLTAVAAVRFSFDDAKTGTL